MTSTPSGDDAGPIELPIDGTLDLHTFKPNEIGDLVRDYLAACQERGILEVRIVHGKGIGNLKRSVRALLSTHPEVIRFADASGYFGGFGATVATLRAKQRAENGARGGN